MMFCRQARRVPYPLTLFTMTYAASRGVPEAGLMFALAMLIGVGLVFSVTAFGAVSMRQTLTRFIARHGTKLQSLTRY